MFFDKKTNSLGKNFWLYRASRILTIFGNKCGDFALAWWLLEGENPVARITSALAIIALSKIVFIPLLSPLGDYLCKRKLYLFADIFCGLFILPMFVMCYLNWSNFYLIMINYICISVGEALAQSVSVSIIPELVDSAKMPEAMRKGQVATSISQIMISAASGFILHFVGTSWCFLLNSLMFFTAAFLVFKLVIVKRHDTKSRFSDIGIKKHVSALKDAVLPFVRNQLLIWITVIIALINFVSCPLIIILPVWVKQNSSSPLILGLLNSGLALGVLIGAIALKYLGLKICKDRIIMLGIAILGSSLLLLSITSEIIVNIVALFVFGFGLIISNLTLTPQLIIAIPDDFRSRIGSLLDFVVKIFTPLGLICAGLLISKAGISSTMRFYGLFAMMLVPLFAVVPSFASFYKKSYKEATDSFSVYHKNTDANDIEINVTEATY